MKKADVEVGKEYVVKVSGKLATVRLDRPHSLGGWTGTNTATGRVVRIRSAARLRREFSPPEKVALFHGDNGSQEFWEDENRTRLLFRNHQETGWTAHQATIGGNYGYVCSARTLGELVSEMAIRRRPVELDRTRVWEDGKIIPA